MKFPHLPPPSPRCLLRTCDTGTAAKNTRSFPRQLTCKTLIALALTVAAYDIKAQSGGLHPDAASVPTSWSGGPNLPSTAVRAVGVYFPGNGLFYAMGGRSADAAGNDFIHPFEYNPGTNTWSTKVGTYPDNQVNNMACAVLNVGGTLQIYCVGGSAAGGTTSASRVFSYNPITDVVNALTAADNWPGNAAGNILPGGFAITGNKLYIVGGFQIGTASTSQTWQFDPNAAIGSRWLQRTDYPLPRSYVPTAAIGGLIYTAGGASIVGTTVTDTADSFKFDPTSNAWGPIVNIPRTTGETRAIVVNNRVWVLGGGRTAPNPSTQVDIFDPAGNAWTTGFSFVTPRRNFPADTDGSRVWLGGGYTTDGLTPQNTMEIFTVPVPVLAVSRKTHGASVFDIPLPLTGNVGIECRSSAGNHTLVVTFTNTVTLSGASVTSGTGTVGTFNASGAQVTVNLSGVTNAQRITVTLANVNDGTTTGDVAIPMGVLAGDTNGSGAVNASDVGQTKAQSGQSATAGNFRTDVNVSGAINGSDIGLVKSVAGTQLPP